MSERPIPIDTLIKSLGEDQLPVLRDTFMHYTRPSLDLLMYTTYMSREIRKMSLSRKEKTERIRHIYRESLIAYDRLRAEGKIHPDFELNNPYPVTIDTRSTLARGFWSTLPKSQRRSDVDPLSFVT